MTTAWNMVGLDTGIASLSQLSKDALHEIAAELEDIADDVFDASQALVPVRYGVLRASGQVRDPVVTADGCSIEIVYGGAAAPYAIYVHENMTAHHASPTQAKFLEQPLMQRQNEIQTRLAKTVADLIGGNG